MADQNEVETLAPPTSHVLVTKDGSLIQVRHDTPEADLDEAGFDLTSFGDPASFIGFLNDLGLDHMDDYGEVDKSPDQPDRTYRNFVWANADIAVITGNNPISGEYSDPSMRGDEPGYASYIGLSGDPQVVDRAYEKVKEYAEHVKEGDRSGRQFI